MGRDDRLRSSAYRRVGAVSGRLTVATCGDAGRDVTPFTSHLRSGNMPRNVRGRGFLVRRGWSDAIDRGEQWRTWGSGGNRSSERRGVAHRVAPATPLPAPAAHRWRRPRRRAGRPECTGRHGCGAADRAQNDGRSASARSGRRCVAVDLVVAASCAAPRWLCAQPRSNLPRSHEAHGCAVRSRDTAHAPGTWRKSPWPVLRAAASRSSARSATVERRPQTADRGMQLAPASLPRRAVHSQTHPPSSADHTAGTYQ